MFLTLFAALVCAATVPAVGGGWWGTAGRARDATGGPVKPATTRGYVMVTIFFALAVAAIFVGLYFMKR